MDEYYQKLIEKKIDESKIFREFIPSIIHKMYWHNLLSDPNLYNHAFFPSGFSIPSLFGTKQREIIHTKYKIDLKYKCKNKIKKIN